MTRLSLAIFLFIGLGTLAAVEQFSWSIAKMTVRVVDEGGVPVEAATVSMTFQSPTADAKNWGSSAGNKIVLGQTNPMGSCTLSDHCDGELGGGVRKDGFYRGWWQPYAFSTSAAGKWQPWNPTVEVVLKRIVRPTAMYARRMEIEIPVIDVPVGFDLIESDWVFEKRRGKTSDFVFKLTKRVESFHNFEAELLLTFANEGDGIQRMPQGGKGGSELRSVRLGPETGYAKPLTFLQGNSKEKREYGITNNPQDYFFRVRTMLDSKGQVVSALYGKIYGSIEYFPVSYKTAKLRFRYYVNPTPNDRNLEFDPKRNLFTNLKPEEQVKEP